MPKSSGILYATLKDVYMHGSIASQAYVAYEVTPNYFLVLLSCFTFLFQNEHIFPPTSAWIPQTTVLNLVLGGTIFTEGGRYSQVNNVLGDNIH